MTEVPDFMKDIGKFVDELTPDWDKAAPREDLPVCDDPECPLHISKDGFREWLSSYLSNTDMNRPPYDGKVFVVGMAFSDKNPVVRYLHYICPADVNDLKITILGGRLIMNRMASNTRDMKATEALTHPLVSWAVHYIERLREKFRSGEAISVSDALELLD